jgi:alkyl hydroperoxide reductase subunit AhpC
VTSHSKWAADIEETQGHKMNYPLIGDPTLEIARLYDMLPVNWKQGDDVIILPAVSDEEAKQKYPDGWKAPKPYLRIVPQPK